MKNRNKRRDAFARRFLEGRTVPLTPKQGLAVGYSFGFEACEREIRDRARRSARKPNKRKTKLTNRVLLEQMHGYTKLIAAALCDIKDGQIDLSKQIGDRWDRLVKSNEALLDPQKLADINRMVRQGMMMPSGFPISGTIKHWWETDGEKDARTD